MQDNRTSLPQDDEPTTQPEQDKSGQHVPPRKKAYEKPAIIYRGLLETMANACVGGKSSPDQLTCQAWVNS
jgi:hypothetical protein